MGTLLRPSPRKSTLTRLSLTVALPVQALLVNEWLRPVLEPAFEPAFIAAVSLVCWFCGLRYALAALALSSLLLDYFFLPPYGELGFSDAPTMIKFAFFIGANVITSSLISTLYRTHSELAASEQLYRNLAELIPFGGWLSDSSGNMQHISESFLKTFGTTAEETKGLGWLRFIDAEQRDLVLAEWSECMRNGYFWDYEYRMRTPEGKRYVVLSRGVPVRGPDGRVRSWVGIHLDITDRERMLEERIRQARDIARFNAELEQLAYVSAHDLQEPLRSIASYLQLLARRYKGKLDSEADQYIEYAVEGATRLRTLLSDLLVLQQIGKGTRQTGRCSMSEIVSRALLNLGESVESATIVVDPLPDLACDEHEFTQVFEHLIGNGVTYVREGVRPELHIASEQTAEGWVICVSDNGIGMEAEYLQRIFEVFQRLHPRSEYPGTGMGLAICRKVVEVHGGRIWAESTPGKGSTFRFTIPDSRIS